jgi:hypothetical protein
MGILHDGRGRIGCRLNSGKAPSGSAAERQHATLEAGIEVI